LDTASKHVMTTFRKTPGIHKAVNKYGETYDISLQEQIIYCMLSESYQSNGKQLARHILCQK